MSNATKPFTCVVPKYGDKVIDAPELKEGFEGHLCTWFVNQRGDWFAVVEITPTSGIFHICPLEAVRRVTEGPGEARIDKYTVPK